MDISVGRHWRAIQAGRNQKKHGPWRIWKNWGKLHLMYLLLFSMLRAFSGSVKHRVLAKQKVVISLGQRPLIHPIRWAKKGWEKQDSWWNWRRACLLLIPGLHPFPVSLQAPQAWLLCMWLLLLLLSHFSRVRLCATPETAAHQAPPSLGFSRQEHWSGLPLPSPMHESEKWKWSRSVVSDS